MGTISAPQNYANVQGQGLRLAAMISAQVEMLLADKASIRDLVMFAGDVTGTGSAAIKLRYANYGAGNPFISASDGVSIAAQDMEAATATITIGRSAMRYDLSDLMVMTGLGRDLDPFNIAAGMVEAAEARISTILANTFLSTGTNKGSTAADLTIANFLNALYHLQEKSNNPPFHAVLKPSQFNHLQKALRSENNNFLSYSPNTREMANAKPQGYCGEFLGVEVYKSSRVVETADTLGWHGAMFAKEGIGYGIGSPSSLVGSDTEICPAGSPVVISFQRDESAGLSEIVGHLYCGAAILQQDMVVGITTKK